VLSQICSTANGASPWIGIKGIYHMTAAGETTWYDFAGRILDLAVGRSRGGDWFRAATGDRPLVARRIVSIATSQFPTPARRPAYSVLANKKLSDTFGVSLPHWETQLRSVFSEGTRDTHAQVTNEEHRPRH
jgi:dTDP-4-dehydrorhamnose reductase